MFIFGYLIKKLLEDIFHQNLYYYINKKGSKETLGFALTLLLKCVFTMMIMGLFCDPFLSIYTKDFQRHYNKYLFRSSLWQMVVVNRPFSELGAMSVSVN